jgi:hypothetical protein
MAFSDDPSFGNLKNSLRNPKAAEANLRTGRFSSGVALKAVKPSGGGGLAFEAMMAVNESNNQVIGQVLDGPVSQQTQRQLAQLKAQTAQNPNLAQLAKTGRSEGLNGGQIQKAVSDGELAKNPLTAGARIFGNLQGGRTVKKGLHTGKIFSPSQLTSFRKRNGLTLLALKPEAGGERSAATSLTAKTKDAAALDKESPLAMAKSEANGKMSENAILAAQKALNYGAVMAGAEAVKKTGQEAGKKSSLIEKIDGIIAKVSGALGLDPNLVKAVVKTESNFDQKAVSKAGAKGLMQLMPTTAKEMGVSDPFNPFENIWGGARYLKRMLDRQGGDLNKALAAYNWGPGNLDRYGGARLPKETRRYIEAVNRNYAQYKKESKMA